MFDALTCLFVEQEVLPCQRRKEDILPRLKHSARDDLAAMREAAVRQIVRGWGHESSVSVKQWLKDDALDSSSPVATLHPPTVR
jgi:hypothetical protein